MFTIRKINIANIKAKVSCIICLIWPPLRGGGGANLRDPRKRDPCLEPPVLVNIFERFIREHIEGKENGGGSGVVLDGDVLPADHPIPLEPLAAEGLGRSLGGVGPLEGHAVVVGVLSLVAERLAGDEEHLLLLGVQDSRGGVHVQTLHVGGLDGPADAVRPQVGDGQVVAVLLREGGVVDELGVGLRLDVPGHESRHGCCFLGRGEENRPIWRRLEGANDS